MTKFNVSKNEFKLCVLWGALLGAISFILLYDIRVLNPFYLDWIYSQDGQDVLAAQLGWEFFRKAPWSFPVVGSYNTLNYPIGTSIVYTDSIPLMAIPLKALFSHMTLSFQYFGLWGLISFMLQGILSALLLRRYINDLHFSLLGSLFFICSSGILWRCFRHHSLASHWILLLPMIFYAYRERFPSLKSSAYFWAIICAFAVSIHAYFIVMTGIMLCAYILDDYLKYKKAGRSIVILGSSLFSTIITFWFIGGFANGGGAISLGVGHYSMNLNALFNSMDSSLLLRGLPLATSGQYEGYQYLGIGFLFLLILSIYHHLFYRQDQGDQRKTPFVYFLPIIFLCLSSILLALSPVVTFGNTTLINYNCDFLNKLLGPFRASGRFFWPVWYLILSWSLTNFFYATRHRIQLSRIVLLLLLSLQLYDLSGIHAKLNINEKYSSPFVNAFWKDAFSKYTHIALVQSFWEGWGDFEIVASRNDSTLDIGYIGRGPSEKDYCKMLESKIYQINSGLIDPNTIYIKGPKANTLGMIIEPHENTLHFFVDGYDVFLDKWTYLKKFKVVNEGLLWLPPIYSLGSEVYFSVNGNARDYFTGGLSGPENDVTWTLGKKATMFLRFNEELKKDMTLLLKYRCTITEKQRIIAKIRDKKIFDSYVNSQDGQVKIPLPADCIEKRQLKLSLEFPDAVSPKDIKLNEDTRILSCFLQSFVIF